MINSLSAELLRTGPVMVYRLSTCGGRFPARIKILEKRTKVNRTTSNCVTCYGLVKSSKQLSCHVIRSQCLEPQCSGYRRKSQQWGKDKVAVDVSEVKHSYETAFKTLGSTENTTLDTLFQPKQVQHTRPPFQHTNTHQLFGFWIFRDINIHIYYVTHHGSLLESLSFISSCIMVMFLLMILSWFDAIYQQNSLLFYFIRKCSVDVFENPAMMRQFSLGPDRYFF